MQYGVATVSRILKMIGIFCKRALQKRRYSAQETYNFKEPTNHSHPIVLHVCCSVCCSVVTSLELFCSSVARVSAFQHVAACCSMLQ